MKIKVIQYFMGDNANYIKMSQLTEKINRKYCEIHNYDYQCERLDNSQYIDPNLYKIKYMNDTLNDSLNNYDYVAFMEFDIAVSKPIIKIEDIINNEYELFFSRGNDRLYQIITAQSLCNNLITLLKDNGSLFFTNYFHEFVDKFNLYHDLERLSLGNIFFNEGFFIVKNTPLTKEFFQLCTDFGKYFLNRIHEGIYADGAVLCFFLQQKRFNNLYTFLPDYAQGGFANSYEGKYDENKTFVLHNYGKALNFDQKYDALENLLNNKWWKGIKC